MEKDSIMLYFIRDYNDKIVGNPKGYSTLRGARIAIHCKYKQYSKLRYYLREIYDNAVAHGHTSNIIYSIKLAK